MKMIRVNVLLLVFLVSCTSKEEREYTIKVTTERASKNQQFATDDAPLTEEQHLNFTGLKYYPIDMGFKVACDLVPHSRPKTVVLEQGDTLTQMIKYGQIRFNLNGNEWSLTVFKPVPDPFSKEEDYLFVPFFDNTNGKETYEGGRYAYPEFDREGNLILDFNLASNPYCAYNHKYNCVVPPGENTISVEIKAGEKTYQ